MRVRVPAVFAVRELKRTNKTLEAIFLFEPLPDFAGTETFESVTLFAEKIRKTVEFGVGKSQGDHRGGEFLGVGPVNELGNLRAATLLYERAADRTGPNAATGREVAKMGFLVKSGEVDGDELALRANRQSCVR